MPRGRTSTVEATAVANPDDHLVCYMAKLAKKATPQAGCGAIDPKVKTKIAPRRRSTRRRRASSSGTSSARLDSIVEREICIPSEKVEL